MNKAMLSTILCKNLFFCKIYKIEIHQAMKKYPYMTFKPIAHYRQELHYLEDEYSLGTIQ